MTMRLSTGLTNFLAKQGSIDGALRNGWIDIFTGPQPASADAAATGTLLCRITSSALALVNEAQAVGSVTLTGGSAGSVDSITVNGVNVLGASVPFDGTLAQTATDVAAQINRFKSAPDYTAIAVGAVISLYAGLGVAAGANGYVVAASATTVTTSVANMSGGVAGSNGLLFDNAVGGVITKLATQVWSGVNLASGVASWFRQHGPIADANLLDSTYQFMRLDGAISTSGSELNLSNTSLVSGATSTVQTWQMTVPNQ